MFSFIITIRATFNRSVASIITWNNVRGYKEIIPEEKDLNAK